MSTKCHYCANAAAKTLCWLKNKKGNPARIMLPWCGCDLMGPAAIQRIWPNPYPVVEGVDYEVLPLDGGKPALAHGLFCDDPATPEGKYLVQRRDGTVPEWPNFVLGAPDPIAEVALTAYAVEVRRILMEDPAEAKALRLTEEFHMGLVRRIAVFRRWRESHGKSDPGAGRHRKDDPATVEKMRRGQSA